MSGATYIKTSGRDQAGVIRTWFVESICHLLAIQTVSDEINHMDGKPPRVVLALLPGVTSA